MKPVKLLTLILYVFAFTSSFMAEAADTGYSKIIDQSKISPSVKTELKSNISIAPASHNLWRTVDVFAK